MHNAHTTPFFSPIFFHFFFFSLIPPLLLLPAPFTSPSSPYLAPLSLLSFPLLISVYVANRVSDKLTQISDRIFCCRSGSSADTQATADIVKTHLNLHR